MTRYYHVIKRQHRWCLYADNAMEELAADPALRAVVRAARAAARRDGARVVVHKDPAAGSGNEAAPAESPPGAASPPVVIRRSVSPSAGISRVSRALATQP